MRYLILILLVISGDCYGKPEKFLKNNSHAGRGIEKPHHAGNPVINIDNRRISRPVQTRGGEGVPGGNVTTYTNIESDRLPAHTASFISPGDCQSGTSGQGQDGGISIVTRDALCDYWDAAEVALKAYQLEEVNATCRPTSCVVNCSMDGYVEAELITCTDTPLGQKYLDDYHHNLKLAQELIDSTVVGDKVDRQVSAWSKVLFWLAIVVWLA